MNFPPGYRDLRTYRSFARLSGLAHPIENIFTFYAEIQISKSDTFLAMDDEAFLDLLCVEEEIEGATIKKALLRSGMAEETGTPGVYFAKEFCELNKGLFSSRENGGMNKGSKKRNKGTNQLTKEGTDELTKEGRDELTKEGRDEPTDEPINRLRDEGSNELTKEIKKGLTDERINELMNGTVTDRQPTGNPQVTHGSESDLSEDWDEEGNPY